VFAPLSDYRDAESWPPWANGLFITFSRPLWAAALGVVATACAAGRLPRVDAFLAHPAWTPLARLTFGAYLMHPVVIKWFAGTATAPYHFSPHYMVSCAMLNAACAFALAAALWLAVEKPGMRLAAAVAGAGNAARRGESGRGG
jgi:peptidoglycan/LPS O-acetylase OafA/YrhL